MPMEGFTSKPSMQYLHAYAQEIRADYAQAAECVPAPNTPAISPGEAEFHNVLSRVVLCREHLGILGLDMDGVHDSNTTLVECVCP